MIGRDRTPLGESERADRDQGQQAGEDLDARSRGLLHMQRTMGNAAVQAMSRSPVMLQSMNTTPSWMEEDLGITPQHKTNFQTAQRAEQDPAQLSRGGAQPLPAEVKTAAEDHHGYRMDDVRVIQGGQADTYCDNMNARAFCTPGQAGSDIFVSSGVDLSSKAGQHTLHHEIAHAVQNATGETSGLNGLGGDTKQRQHLEEAADRHADSVVSKNRA